MASTLLTTLLLLPLTAHAIDPPRAPTQPTGNGTRQLLFNQTTPASLIASPKSVSWISAEEDGKFMTEDDEGALVLESIVSGESKMLVAADKIPDEDWWDHWVSPDASRVLWAVNHTKQYRHSYFADYLVQDVESGEVTPLVEDQVGDIQYAEFAPTGGAIAFVRGNNLYISNGSEVTQVTKDGGPDMFHGVPDWVYEEEIFGDRYSLWFSPDAQFMAFLSFNETGVGTFRVPYYMDNQEIAPQYPRELELRYPKVGTTNPTVQFNILDLATMEYETIPVDAFEPNNTVIGEVSWVTDEHSAVIYAVYNRVQDLSKHVVVDPVEKSSTVVRERDGTDGWLDNLLAIRYVGAVDDSNMTYYVDLSDESGWNHIYLCPVGETECTQLTDGEWEVTDLLKVDTARQLIYYTSTEVHITERHLYSVSFSGEKTALVDESVPAYWSASFSAGGDYYILNYLGPNVPYQDLYSINSTTTPLTSITTNSALLTNLTEYSLPTTSYFNLTHPDGYTLQIMERLPVNFDPAKKYPVIFLPYGGPGAQEVDKQMMPFNFRYYLSCDPELSFVSYTVDGRGTGYAGREFRATVAKHLGRLEPLDQIWVAQQLLSEGSEQSGYLDAEHVGIYGHSFGGYLTAKVLELQGPEGPFTFGISGAPVSDWRFYDSLYTERYMKTLEDNEAGYNETAVRNATGFSTLKGQYAVAHGIGDDNVHFQNTAALLDLLVGSREVGPEKLRMAVFTDSDHGIVYNGANVWLSKFYAEFLMDELQRGEEGGLVHQWSKREVEEEEKRGWVARRWFA